MIVGTVFAVNAQVITDCLFEGGIDSAIFQH